MDNKNQTSKFINDSIRSFSSAQKQLIFPNDDDIAQQLRNDDYLSYLNQINNTLTQTKTIIPQIYLNNTNLNTINGLNAFYEQEQNGVVLNCNELKIDIDNEIITNNAITTLLNNLAKNNATNLTLHANKKLTEKNIKNFVTNIQNNKDLAIEITLPMPWYESKYQKTIDEIMSDRIANKELNEQTPITERIIKTNKTKRKLPAVATTNVDFEHEHEHEHENETESETEQVIDDSTKNKKTYIVLNNITYASDPNPLYSKSYKLTNAQLETSTSQWIGAQNQQNNNYLIEERALTKLLKFHEQFQAGIDIHRLPAGFVIREDKNHIYIDFDETKQKNAKDNPLAIQLHEDETKPNITHSTFTKALGLVSDESPIQQNWQKLQAQEKYKRESLQTFKNYLPEMLQLSDESLNNLFKTCWQNDEFDVRLFTFLINNIDAIPQNINDLYNNTALLNCLPQEKINEEFLNYLINYKTSYQKNSIQLEQHLVYKLANENQKEILQELIKDVPELNLNALIPLTIPEKNNKLHKLCDLYKKNPDLFKKLHQDIYKKNKRYQEWISTNTSEAIEIINGFNQNEKTWWNKLLEEHVKIHNDSNLHDLTQAFTSFKKELESFGLELPKECLLKNIKSLPTSLSYLSTILKNTPSENREEVWQQLQTMDISSYGVIKTQKDLAPHIDPNLEKKRITYAFVTENMHLDKENQNNNNEFDIPESFDKWYEEVRQNKKIDLKKLEEQFFRYVATQGQNAQLPLKFYLDAYKKIKESKLSVITLLDDKAKAKLIVILAASSTNPVNTQLSKDTEQTKKYLDEIITGLKSITLDKFLNLVLDKIADLKNMPPLVYILPILKFIQAKTTLGLSLISNRDILIKVFNQLKSAAESYGMIVYQGMQAYTEADLAQENILQDHCETLHIITMADSTFKNEYTNLPMLLKNLTAIISTFNIKPNDIAQKKGEEYELKDDSIVSYLRDLSHLSNLNSFAEAMQILANIDKSKNPQIKLTTEVLKDILYKVNNQSKNNVQVIDIIKNYNNDDNINLSSLFPENYFTEFIEKDIPPAIIKKLKAFKETEIEKIKTILVKFHKPGDNENYNLIVDKLLSLKKILQDSALENLIDYLADSDGLYTNENKLDANHPFVQLLNSLKSQRSIHSVIILLSAAKKREQTSALCEKALALTTELLPNISNIENRNISTLEYTKLLIETLLATPQENLLKPKKEISEQNKNIDKAIDIITAYNNISDNDLTFLRNLKISELNNLANSIAAIKTPPQTTSTVTNVEGNNNQKPTAAKRLWTSIWNYITSTEDTENLEITNNTSTTSTASISSQTTIISKETIDNALNNLTAQKEKINFSTILGENYTKINDIITKYPFIHKPFLEIYKLHLENYSSEKGDILTYLTNFTDTLNDVFNVIQDEDTILSLCVQFNTKKKLTPNNLLLLLDQIKTQDNDDKKFLLSTVTGLINDNKGYDFDDFQQFCNIYSTNKDTIKRIYNAPPIPSLKQIIDWNKNNQLESSYKEYRNKPATRAESSGFDLQKAQDQWGKFTGLQNIEIDFEDFEKLTKELQSKNTDELIDTFKQKENKLSIEQLVAISAELLYRCKGKDTGKPGDSMELNTTQYLACLATLKSGKLVTSQIGTGEGKSRIFTIINAVKYAQDLTVDTLTSDMILARRDYLAAKSFYNMLGIPSALISASSKPESYQKQGINFSDIYNLGSFRNNARSKGQDDVVVADEKSKRHLSLDEGDLAFDMAFTRINISVQADQSIRNMPWVYPLMMRYFAQKDILLTDGTKTTPQAIYEDRNLSLQKFREFAANNCSKEQLSRLNNVSDGILERWQESALIANSLKIGEQFSIQEEIISIHGVEKKVNRAVMLRGGTPEPNSKLSKGVYQFLQAKLELIKHGKLSSTDTNLNEELKKCSRAPFEIADEKTIIYSSTMIDMILDYESMLFISGTTGHQLERNEAQILYSQDDHNPMIHIDVPRDKEYLRKDKVLFTPNNEDHIKQIIDNIKDARNKNQPILILTEDDNENASLLDAIKQNFHNDNNIQQVNSKTDLNDKEVEEEILDNAKIPGFITVSTGRTSRGYDFAITDVSKEYGLETIITYLPESQRALDQGAGRSARQGQAGSFKLILNKERIPKYINKSDDINKHYALIAKEMQSQRVIAIAHALFLREIRHAFYLNTLKKMIQKGTIQENDENYLKLRTMFGGWLTDANDKWNEYLPEIQEILNKHPINDNSIQQINEIFKKYQESIEPSWTNFRNNLLTTFPDETLNTQLQQLTNEVPKFTINNEMENILTNYTEVEYTIRQQEQEQEQEQENTITTKKPSLIKNLAQGLIFGVITITVLLFAPISLPIIAGIGALYAIAFTYFKHTYELKTHNSIKQLENNENNNVNNTTDSSYNKIQTLQNNKSNTNNPKQQLQNNENNITTENNNVNNTTDNHDVDNLQNTNESNTNESDTNNSTQQLQKNENNNVNNSTDNDDVQKFKI